MAPSTGRPRPDTEVVFDPGTYTGGVPFEALARLRRHTPVAWVPEIPVLGWPEGPGFWLVLRHADVESVLRRPDLFSSALGATQIRDPATPGALSYVRRMMLNMDPPDHSRLRRLLSRSFTPRAVARLEDRIRGHARAICDRVFTGPRGECDFAKDVAADLPLLALADVLGVPEQDRWLLFDWSNRVIGYQDPDYASSAEFDPAAGTAMAREALAAAAVPGPGGRMPDPRTREGMPDLYAYAHLLAEEKRRRPGDDVMSILLAQSDEGGARVSVAEFENMFWLFAVAGNETLRNGLPGACIALLEHPAAQDELRADPDLLPVAADEMLRWWTPVMTFRRTAAEDCQIGSSRSVREKRSWSPSPRPTVTRPSSPIPGDSTSAASPTRTWCSGTARTSASAPTWPAPRCAPCSPRCWPARPGSKRPGRRPTCAPTSSAASSACPSPGPPDQRRGRPFQHRCSIVQRRPGTVASWAGPGSRDHSPPGPAVSPRDPSQAPARVITGMSVVTAKLNWGRFCDGKRPWSRTRRRTDQPGRTGRAGRARSGGQVNAGG